MTRRKLHEEAISHHKRSRRQFPLQGFKHSLHSTISTKNSSTLDRKQLSLLEGITQGITTFTCVPMLGYLALVQRASSQTKESKRRADDDNDITKGEARLICRCSTSFFSSSTSFFASCSCTASSPAAQLLLQLHPSCRRR